MKDALLPIMLHACRLLAEKVGVEVAQGIQRGPEGFTWFQAMVGAFSIPFLHEWNIVSRFIHVSGK